MACDWSTERNLDVTLSMVQKVIWMLVYFTIVVLSYLITVLFLQGPRKLSFRLWEVKVNASFLRFTFKSKLTLSWSGQFLFLQITRLHSLSGLISCRPSFSKLVEPYLRPLQKFETARWNAKTCLLQWKKLNL